MLAVDANVIMLQQKIKENKLNSVNAGYQQIVLIELLVWWYSFSYFLLFLLLFLIVVGSPESQ